MKASTIPSGNVESIPSLPGNALIFLDYITSDLHRFYLEMENWRLLMKKLCKLFIKTSVLAARLFLSSQNKILFSFKDKLGLLLSHTGAEALARWQPPDLSIIRVVNVLNNFPGPDFSTFNVNF